MLVAAGGVARQGFGADLAVFRGAMVPVVGGV